MTLNKFNLIGSMLFLKFSILMVVIVALTMVKPAVIAAHKGTQKICFLVMQADECVKHC
jgi:hypothetical protein